jgi:signal transduction histidine kinase
MLASGKVIGILAMANTNPGIFTDEHIHLAEGIAVQASVAIQNAWLFEQVRAGHERLQMLSRRLVEVQEGERRYVARELHDEAGQILTALKFGLRLLEQDVDNRENLLAGIAELISLSDRILENIHRLAMDLRPASLDHLGLVATLEQLVEDTHKRYNINVRFKAAGFSETQRLPAYVETNLYRIVQEALTNAVRHASAGSVDVILELRDGSAVAIVEDDGDGFDIAQVDKSGHLGLLGMEERAQMMGGVLQIESSRGRGTTIVVEVPYANSNLDR